MPRLDRVSSRLPTATCRRLPRPPRIWVGDLQCGSLGIVRIVVPTRGRRHASAVACTQHHLPTGQAESPWQGSAPRRGRREESPATICHPNPQGSTRMVMVAERYDAGMRRRARRDQNDREEKAETMRRKSRDLNLRFPQRGARSRAHPPRPPTGFCHRRVYLPDGKFEFDRNPG